MHICENIVAQCVGLSLPRTIEHNSTKLDVSEARFVIAATNGLQHGLMLFWNEDVQWVKKLVLGKVYRFFALKKDCKEGILMFFIPKYTKFHELTSEEAKEIGF